MVICEVFQAESWPNGEIFPLWHGKYLCKSYQYYDSPYLTYDNTYATRRRHPLIFFSDIRMAHTISPHFFLILLLSSFVSIFFKLVADFLTKIIYYICVTLSLVGSNFTTNIKYIKTIYIYTMNQEVKNQLYTEPKYLSTFTPFFLLFFNNKLLWTRFSVLALFRSMFDNHGF